MPAGYMRCTRTHGSRVRAKSLSGGRYIPICFSGGKSYAGEVKTRKHKTGKSSRRAVVRRIPRTRRR